MKNIQVHIDAFYGYSCSGGGHYSEQDLRLEVEDNVAATLRDMLASMPVKEDEILAIDKDDLAAAIEDGHDELQPLWDTLIEKGRDMMVHYWLIDADIEDCLDESLEPAFFQDIDDGTYVPSMSLEEYIEHGDEGEDEDDYDDRDKTEEDYRYDFYHEYREEYRTWVENHVDDDPWFAADRLGVDISYVLSGEDDESLSFHISEVEQ